jgi:hypothetical protein
MNNNTNSQNQNQNLSEISFFVRPKTDHPNARLRHFSRWRERENIAKASSRPSE